MPYVMIPMTIHNHTSIQEIQQEWHTDIMHILTVNPPHEQTGINSDYYLFNHHAENEQHTQDDAP
eukprot:1637477-Prorocentrum_lima.AAC.1